MPENFFEIQNGNFTASEKNKVNNVNLVIEKQGEIISLLGPSGIGKTTILRTIAGLQKLSGGKIKLRDTILASDEIHIEPEKRNVALSFQDNSLFPNYKVIDNINFGEKRANGHGSSVDVKEIIERAEGSISMITLAPEVVEEKIIKLILDNDIVISIGHSELSYKNTIEYINKGVNASTHLFNAMPSIHHRDKNLTLAILENDKIFSSIICDGFHVDFSMIRLAHKLKRNSLFCITDGVTESNDEQYSHKFNGKFYENNGILSGSSVTMHESFKNLINKVGLSFNEALEMCCVTPSKVFKNKNLLPLDTNSKNSFNILDKNLNLIK